MNITINRFRAAAVAPLLALLLLSVTVPSARSQETSDKPKTLYRLGVFGGINLVQQTASFGSQAGVVDCGTFTGGNAVQPFFGALFELPRSNTWSLGLSAAYTQLGAPMNA